MHNRGRRARRARSQAHRRPFAGQRTTMLAAQPSTLHNNNSNPRSSSHNSHNNLSRHYRSINTSRRSRNNNGCSNLANKVAELWTGLVPARGRSANDQAQEPRARRLRTGRSPLRLRPRTQTARRRARNGNRRRGMTTRTTARATTKKVRTAVRQAGAGEETRGTR